MKKLPIIAAGGILLLALAGCSNEPAADSSKSVVPKPAASSEAEASEYVAPDVAAECVDGTATITDSSANVTIGDCATVVVEASDSTITLGAVTTLTVNGSINAITVASVETIVLTANGNTVTTPGAPTVDDQGEQNEVLVP